MSRVFLALLLVFTIKWLPAQSAEQQGDALRQQLEQALAAHNTSGTLNALQLLDHYYAKQSLWEMDAPILRQTISIWSSEVGSESVGAARYSVRLSDVLVHLKDYAGAKLLLKSAISIFEANGALYEYAGLRAKRRLVRLLKLENKTQEAGLLESTLPFLLPKEPSDTKPDIIAKTEPAYTEEARRHRVSGFVQLGVSIDENGRVSDVKIIQPMGLGLDESAIEAVKTWRFKPASLDGDPVGVRVSVECSFRSM